MKIEIKYVIELLAPMNIFSYKYQPPAFKKRYKFIQNKHLIKEFFVDPNSNKIIVVASWGLTSEHLSSWKMLRNIQKMKHVTDENELEKLRKETYV